jgi:flagellar protein FlbD
MILLTKLDQTRILVPIEAIKYVEETPDTLIRFQNGETLIVKENLETLCELTQAARQRIFLGSHTMHMPSESAVS